ncbi:hypothetical protein DM01DRAFT_1318833 [Hesseltinella vesiculosa]|uniref:GPR1/FUN34/yaaH family protein n=1 Tax=Hesseltinella vesiculosa TaxID=101127 RepID=A0A1X2GNW2_9FUNG|nr:hypothetical protein DM01DRAFT_1318833 [Hesseltinella vesiculosa]
MQVSKYNFVPLAFQGFSFGSIALGFCNIGLVLPQTVPQMAIGMCFASAFLGLTIGSISEILQGNVAIGTTMGTNAGFYLAYMIMFTPSTGLLADPRDLQIAASVLSFAYGIPTFFFFIGTLKHGLWLIKLLMLEVSLAYILSGAGNAINNSTVVAAGGWFSIILGVTAWYISFAMIFAVEDSHLKLPLF